jgi:hypothetical protein
MPRPAMPTEIQDAKGYFVAHPERKRDAEPTDNRPLGNAPRWLTPEQVEVWTDLADDLLPGVGKRSDRTAFEQLVRLVCQMRTNQPMMAADRTAMVSLLGRFAMTPADRSKVAVTEAPKSALDSFLKRQPTTTASDLN